MLLFDLLIKVGKYISLLASQKRICFSRLRRKWNRFCLNIVWWDEATERKAETEYQTTHVRFLYSCLWGLPSAYLAWKPVRWRGKKKKKSANNSYRNYTYRNTEIQNGEETIFLRKSAVTGMANDGLSLAMLTEGLKSLSHAPCPFLCWKIV